MSTSSTDATMGRTRLEGWDIPDSHLQTCWRLMPTARANADLESPFFALPCLITSKYSMPGSVTDATDGIALSDGISRIPPGAIMALTYDDRRRLKLAIDARRRHALEGRDLRRKWDNYVSLAMTEANGDPIEALNLLLDVREVRGELPVRQHVRRDRPSGT